VIDKLLLIDLWVIKLTVSRTVRTWCPMMSSQPSSSQFSCCSDNANRLNVIVFRHFEALLLKVCTTAAKPRFIPNTVSFSLFLCLLQKDKQAITKRWRGFSKCCSTTTTKPLMDLRNPRIHMQINIRGLKQTSSLLQRLKQLALTTLASVWSR